MHEVLANRLGGLSLPRKSVVRLIDRPDMTLDVYRGCKTTMQRCQVTPAIMNKQSLILVFIHFVTIYLYEHFENFEIMFHLILLLELQLLMELLLYMLLYLFFRLFSDTIIVVAIKMI